MPSKSSPGDPLDPILLQRLHKRLMELRRSDHTASADEVLEELHPSIRSTYESPLLQLLGEAQNADGEVTLDPTFEETRQEDWTVDLPAGFNAPPVDLPPAKRVKPKRPKPRPAEETTQKLPEYIGKFRIKGELGRGANGVVYLGYDEELQRNVAIKLSLVSDERYQQRLRVEASKAAQIDADGIVPVHHIGTTDEGAVYIVQKYIEGSTLRDVLKNNGPLSPARGVRLIREIAMALEPAHLRDILHRDLKPDNILIDQAGKAWISDFGLAISEEEQQGRRSELAGTPAYMSPEQIKGRIDFLDPRSDIWAVGVMFYEVLTGKLPFSGKDRKTLADQICERDPRPMQQRAPQHLSEEMNDVFVKCCGKKPADRFASTYDLITALDQLIELGLSEHNIDGKLISAYATDTLFKYATTTGVEPVPPRHTRTTMRTERVSATQHSTTHHTPTIQEKTSRQAIWLAAAALVGVIGLITFLVVGSGGGDQDPESSPITNVPPVEQPNQFQPPPPTTDPKGTADGSSEQPWIVAEKDGTHTSIQAALSEPGEEHFIHVIGAMNESVEITESVTIRGINDAEASDEQAMIRSPNKRAIFIKSDEGDQVTLENLYIDGGNPDNSEINTIDLFAGKLTIDGCRVESRSQNCIKVHGGALTVTGNQCSFQSPPDSNIDAIVIDRGSLALIENSELIGGGIELNSNGNIHNCTFRGGAVVTTQSADVTIDDSAFQGATTRLEVRAGSNTTLVDCQFDQCAAGVILYFDPFGSVKESGELTIRRTAFDRCTEGIYVVGGDLRIWQGCEFNRCGTALRIEVGSALLESPVIIGGAIGIKLGRSANQESENFPIEPGAAELTIHGGQLRDASTAALVLDHAEGVCRIEASGTNENQQTLIEGKGVTGILLNQCPELVIQGASFKGGGSGITFNCLDAQTVQQYTIEKSKFRDHSNAPVEAFGKVLVTLKDCDLPDDAKTAQMLRVPTILRED